VKGRQKADLGRFGAPFWYFVMIEKSYVFWRERVMTLEIRVYK